MHLVNIHRAETEAAARSFAEEYPFVRFLPASFLTEASVRPDVKLHAFLLGFGSSNRRRYREWLFHNPLVTFEHGAYRCKPVHYHLCDTAVDTTVWEIVGLKQALEGLDESAYFPLPALSYDTTVIDAPPSSNEVLSAITRCVHKNSVVVLLLDNDVAQNETLVQTLTSTFAHAQNVWLLVPADDAPADAFDAELTAKTLHEIYTIQSAGDDVTDLTALRLQADDSWRRLDPFTRRSNLYAITNLRAKLCLLGLNYRTDGTGLPPALLQERLKRRDHYRYEEYFAPSVRNALIAQEHARWNAFHLLSGFLPLAKKEIVLSNGRAVTKNLDTKRHACLTTYIGLDALSAHLATLFDDGRTPSDFDYYIYDEMLITAADKLLAVLGCSVEIHPQNEP